ncbi:NlpC/P60 family protein [Vibrio sp.]|uniref:C40 family peptidase n=1 Tax=Vibrio sp. TaxID=678 RepID=UPI00311DEEC2
MDSYIKQLLSILLLLITAGCTSLTQTEHLVDIDENSVSSPITSELKHNLLSFYKDWAGVPYQLGGNSRYGIDCSAFVQKTYLDVLNIRLPRTTRLQVKVGKQIDYENALVGDLVFFKTSPSVKHVGVYIGQKRFVHASTSKGVIISRLDNPYWASKFWHFRRIYSPT